MARPSFREKIVEAGVELLHQRGYSACGVREITEAAGVPLGSFTNHFRSKEAFAEVVLDRYLAILHGIMAQTLRDQAQPPLERIASYFAAIEDIAGPLQWRFGCMAANLGLELPTLSEALRGRLGTALQGLTEPFREAIADGQASGEVRCDLSADDLSVVALSAWHGALLRAKVDRSGDVPLSVARVLPLLLGAPGAS